MTLKQKILTNIDYSIFYGRHLKGFSPKLGRDEVKCLCPFHNDTKKPNLQINIQTGLFYCFACGAGGNIFKFYQLLFSVDYWTSIKEIAAELGITGSQTKKEPPKMNEDIIPSPLTQVQVDKMAANLKKSEHYKAYLEKERGISSEVWSKYEIGLAGRKELMIPIKNDKGEIVNIRQYKKDREPKMLPYSKGRPVMLYPGGLIQGQQVVITEGELDGLCLESNTGLEFRTGTAGCQTWKKEWNGVFKDKDVIIAYDNDNAGRQGADKVAQNLSGVAKSISIIVWPDFMEDKEDITDFFVKHKKTKDDFMELIKKAKKFTIKKSYISKNPQSKEEDVKIIEDEITSIHPALDFTKELAIITIPLPTQYRIKDKNGVSVMVRDEYWVVTDKKEMFRLNNKELLNRNFYTSGTCYLKTNRWHYKNSLKPWLKNSVDVNPGELFLSIKERYEYYLDYIDTELYSFNALWVIGTYFFPLFYAYPILFLNGCSGSGKSKTIDVTELLAFIAINTSNMSNPSIYRITQGTRATLLLDENEKIANPKSKEHVNLLLAGFKKGAKVIRLEKNKGNEYIPTWFEVHCPKMIANTKGIHEETLKNRCIPFILTPTQSEKSNRCPDSEDPVWQSIRNQIYIFMMNSWRGIRDIKITGSDFGLHGYAFMMWKPILTIAKYLEKFIGGEVFNEMVTLAKEKTSDRKEEVMERYDRQLIKLIREMTGNLDSLEPQDSHIFLSSAKIFEDFKTMLGFDPDNVPKWFTSQRVGRMVSSLNVGKPKTENNVRGHLIDMDKLDEVVHRFGVV